MAAAPEGGAAPICLSSTWPHNIGGDEVPLLVCPDTCAVGSALLQAVRLGVVLTFSAALIGAVVGPLSFVPPEARSSQGGLAFVPLISVVTAGVVALLAGRLIPDDPAHSPSGRTEPDRLFNMLIFMTLAGVSTMVVGVIGTRGDSTAAAGCEWTLTGDHGVIWCVSHQRWLAVRYGSSELAAGVVTTASAVARGFLNEQMRRLRRG